MAELILARHAQASFGAENYDQLSELGTQQSAWLGEYFAGADLAFDAVICGALKRHRQTVDTALGRMNGSGVPAGEVLSDDNINEYDFEGLLRAYGERHPDDPLLADWQADPSSKSAFYRLFRNVLTDWVADDLPAATESWQQFQDRIAAFGERLMREFAGAGRVLVVTSGGPIAILLGQVLELNPARTFDLNLAIRNASITRCRVDAGRIRLDEFNGVPHLDHPDRRHAITYA